LRDVKNSITLAKLPAVSSLQPAMVVPVGIEIFAKEGCHMMRKNTWAIFAMAAMLSLPLTACKDTKTLQENEQLKAQVAELQKDNGQLGNDLETMTAARDALQKENEKLKAEMKPRKKHSKAASRKHRRT
jgi:FtsZ-binding cell division protein ZapB